MRRSAFRPTDILGETLVYHIGGNHESSSQTASCTQLSRVNHTFSKYFIRQRYKMSLLHSTNQPNAANQYFVLNSGTDAAPRLLGNPVILCSGSGAPQALSINAGADAVIRPTGNTGVMNIGAGATNNWLQIAPDGTALFNGTEFAMGGGPPPQLLDVRNGCEVRIRDGAAVDFQGVSAQSNVFRTSSTLPTPIPGGGAGTAQAVPASADTLVPGIYALTLRTPAGAQGDRQISGIGVYTGGLWTSGAVASASYDYDTALRQVSLYPAADRASLILFNRSGSDLTDAILDYTLLVALPA